MIEANTTSAVRQPAPELGSNAWFAAVLREIDRARAKFPTWPTDPLHAVAVLQEEVGELQKAVLERCYKFDSVSFEEVSSEAVQVAAMALRFLDSMMEYNWSPADQHVQRLPCAACDRGDFQLGHADGCAANVKSAGVRVSKTWHVLGILTDLEAERQDFSQKDSESPATRCSATSVKRHAPTSSNPEPPFS